MTTGDATVQLDGHDLDAAPPAHLVAYVSGYGPKIAWFDVDLATGALTPTGSVDATQPSFLALGAAHAYAVNESGNRVAAYAIDPASGALTFQNDQPTGSGPAHVAIDRAGKFVLVANYGGNSAAVYPIGADGALGAALQTVSPGMNAHMVVTDPANHFAFVPCKGSDLVAQFALGANGMLTPNPVPHLLTALGAGPRHLAFAPDGHHAYLIDENASTLMALSYDSTAGTLATIQTTTTRAAAATGANTGAEVVVHPSGKFVYGSNRGDDDIAVFAIGTDGKVALAGNTPTGGATPRSFAIDPTGRWLLAANQGGNTVTTFQIDASTGSLTSVGSPLAATSPAFVGFLALP